MKKNVPFKKHQLKVIQPTYGLVAKKHKVSRTYVRMLAIGERQLKSKKARAIANDLIKLYNVISAVV